MSKQNVLDFFTQVENDSTLKQKVQAAANKEDLLKIAQQSGYSFSAEDIKAIAETTESEELKEEELEAIAGGGVKQIAREVVKTAKDVWNAFWG
ncbi:Nif11-like leader peptide family natural product precursor [Tolypothrix campylonemoides VB511288]|nr:Nif11-like leader peptide family natural product precursor [Tolypothrix campylonemoides VB511288]